MDLLPRPTPVSLRRTNGFDRFGQAQHATAVTIWVHVIDFSNLATKSPLRSNQSASLGRDEEQVAKVKILLAYDEQIAMNDQMTLFGVNLVVTSLRQRVDVFGNPAHQEATLARMEQA